VLEWLRVDLILSHLEREKLTEQDWITIVIVIRSHRSTSAICDLLLQSTDVGGLPVCLCVLGTQVSPAETDEPIKMLFGSILIGAQGTTF